MRIKKVKTREAQMRITKALAGIAMALALFTRIPETRALVSISDAVRILQETQVLASVSQTSPLLREIDGSPETQTAGYVIPGQTVEILRDHQTEWYLVRELTSDRRGWVRREALVIPDEEPITEGTLTDAELESFVNGMGYDSGTAFLAVVDTSRQKLYTFKGSRYQWRLEKVLLCSTGVNESPTVKGKFTLSDRGLWFYSERLKSGGKYWVRFDGPYLVHSLPMDRDGTVLDHTLGRKASSGCVRLSLSDAKWFYDNVGDGTAMVVL